MSFMENRSAISICNRALDRISQQPISGSLDNPLNNVMRVCARHYKTVVRSLLEKHHFGLAVKRTLLVEGVNDRTNEWLTAYTPPADMAFPVTIGPYPSGQVSYYSGIGALYGILSGRSIFAYSGGLIYSQIADTELEYVSFNITEADFNQTFENLVVIFLAAELARPIAKDHKLANDLWEEGLRALNWAIAQNLNVGQPTYGSKPTETELARGGYPTDLLPYGFVG
jgi:hypothetical protein